MHRILKWIGPLRSLFYPQNCPVCNQILRMNEAFICLTCETKLPALPYAIFDKNPIEKLFFNNIPINGATAYLSFVENGSAQKLIHQIKYNGAANLGRFLGTKAANHLLRIAPNYKPEVILPIPLHFSKEKKRGYNQAQLLADGFKEVYGLQHTNNIVSRNKATLSQTKKNRYERFANMEGVFSVLKPKAIKNRHVLVIDDVITSGATTSALCALVIVHQPKSICVYALAYKV